MTNVMLAHGEKIIFGSLRTVYNLYLNQISNIPPILKIIFGVNYGIKYLERLMKYKLVKYI